MIRVLEEQGLSAWPALHTQLFDGWVLRASGGYTRRANSVHPLYPARLTLAEKVAHAEAFYAGQYLPTIFKLTSETQPERLDNDLERLGYQWQPGAVVQTCPLPAVPPTRDANLTMGKFSASWREDYIRLNNGKHTDKRSIITQLFARLDARFATFYESGQAVAVAMLVIVGGYAGVFDVAVDPAYRRQGHGTRLMNGLLAAAWQGGAHTTYLQVEPNNAAAMSLYGKLGFTERYHYWYRVKPLDA